MPGQLRAGHRARALAHDVLVRVEMDEAFADVLLAHRLASAGLSPADRALATRLVYDTLAWQGRLDHQLARLVTRPLPSLDPPVRAALRLGLCQLTILERVPAHAAVDTSVRLARRSGAGAAGLVNAVLRRAAREAAEGHSPPETETDPVERLAVELSHPPWLVELWARELGLDETRALLAANNQRGRTTLRVNPARTTMAALIESLAVAGVRATAGRFAPTAMDIGRDGGVLHELAEHERGCFAFQGEASQLVALMAAPGEGGRVLDVCAAPGGKATALGTAVGQTGSVVALDLHMNGVRKIATEAARLGTGSVHALVADARQLPLTAQADSVLVDAPCSGLGTLRRHPELRWRRQAADIERLATLQGEILEAVAPLVRPGGTLVYAVCTLTEAETTAVVSRFLADHPAFRIDDARWSLPERASELLTPEGALRTLPHRDDLDGFYAVRLLRGGG